MSTPLEALERLFGDMKIKAWIEVLKIIHETSRNRGYTYFSEVLARRGFTGKKGSFQRILTRLEKAGFIRCIKEKSDTKIIPTNLFRKFLEDPPLTHVPCGASRATLKLFLAGHDTAIKVGYEYYRMTGEKLNWLVSAGSYWTGKKFALRRDLKILKRFVKEIFVDSGAQQFYTKFKKSDYPYTPSQYIDFAVNLGAHHIATLDYPLDILVERGISVEEGIQKTVELAVDVVSEAENRSVLNRIVPVLQGYNEPDQWLECFDLYKEHGITLSRFNYWGLGSLCMTRSVRLVSNVVSAVKNALGDEIKLHIFGVNLRALRTVFKHIHSYDTAAWVYWAKMDGAVLVWDPSWKRFIHLKTRRKHQYATINLMFMNLIHGILEMHRNLINNE